MTLPSAYRRRAGPRDLLFFGRPDLWPHWPFLPVVRRHADTGEECGLLFDAARALGLYGFSTTVFLANLFLLPKTLDQFLALPKRVFDTIDELAEDGWTVD